MKTDDEEISIDIEELADAVGKLQEQIKKIRKMQDAVSQIDACEPDKKHTNFLMKWQSTDDKNQSYDFWANGNRVPQMTCCVSCIRLKLKI